MAQRRRQVREEMTEERLEKALSILEGIVQEHGSKFDFLVEQTEHELRNLRQRLQASQTRSKRIQSKVA